jgi:hypothetical protein
MGYFKHFGCAAKCVSPFQFVVSVLNAFGTFSTNQRINESTNQRINESTNQRINESTNQRSRRIPSREMASRSFGAAIVNKHLVGALACDNLIEHKRCRTKKLHAYRVWLLRVFRGRSRASGPG